MGKKKKKAGFLKAVQQIDSARHDRDAKRTASFRRLADSVERFGAQTEISDGDGVQMSAVLEEFIRPCLSDSPTLMEYRSIFPIAIAAWNAAVFPEEQRAEEIEEFIALVNSKSDLIEANALHQHLNALIEHKLKYFPECDRLIVNYDVYEAGGEIQISVASTLPKSS